MEGEDHRGVSEDLAVVGEDLAVVGVGDAVGLAGGQEQQGKIDSILTEGSNCREIVDNTVDMAHFSYIHSAFPVFLKPWSKATLPPSI